MSEIPKEIKQSKDKYGTAHRTKYNAHIDASGRLHLQRIGVQTIVECQGNKWEWATTTVVPQTLLEANQRARNGASRRAPMGDRTACWQKVADGIPVEWLMSQIPVDSWEDEKAVNRLLNSRDYRKFRTDGDFRRL